MVKRTKLQNVLMIIILGLSMLLIYSTMLPWYQWKVTDASGSTYEWEQIGFDDRDEGSIAISTTVVIGTITGLIILLIPLDIIVENKRTSIRANGLVASLFFFLVLMITTSYMLAHTETETLYHETYINGEYYDVAEKEIVGYGLILAIETSLALGVLSLLSMGLENKELRKVRSPTRKGRKPKS